MTHALHRWFPANTVGRDFVVGDLHGCFDLFLAELARVHFDHTSDRIFSVGDLADRGPDSLKCLSLLNKPWFHAVRGNHEQMLLDFAFNTPLPYASNTAEERFFLNGGHWVKSLTPEEQDELWSERLPHIAALPYVITVGSGDTMFHVTHAELMTGEPWVSGTTLGRLARGQPGVQNNILTDNELIDETLATMTNALIWGRRVVNASRPERATALHTALGPLLISRRPWHPGLSLTYVGHTPVNKTRLHASHLFIDRGAFRRQSNSELLMLCHTDVHKALMEISTKEDIS